MSALMPHFRALLSLASLTTVITTLASSSALRKLVASLFHPVSHPVRFVAFLLALILNAKSLPFVWHIRLFRIMVYQVRLQRAPLPKPRLQQRNENRKELATPSTTDAGAIFMPIVTTSMYTPLAECDYNLHKSNSSYFADLDMARTQLVSCLLRKGISESRMSDNYRIAMGAVACHFKREIKPFARFDIWTRVLTWDRKWLYMVSHMVRPGMVKPKGWALQPWKKGTGVSRERKGADDEKEWQSAIFATSIAKYVMKKGRVTVPPDAVLRHSELLPPPAPEVSNGSATSVDGGKDESVAPHDEWEAVRGMVEHERLRGLALAERWGALDTPGQTYDVNNPKGGNKKYEFKGTLHDEFPLAFRDIETSAKEGDDHLSGAKRTVQVLGEFKDLFL